MENPRSYPRAFLNLGPNARLTSAQQAAAHLMAHGSIVLAELTDGSQVVDCKCGAPLGVFHATDGIDWTGDDQDIERYAR